MSFIGDIQNQRNADSVYSTYFYKEDGGDARVAEAIVQYKDSIFNNFRERTLGSEFEILTLKEAKSKYPERNFSTNYYQSQESMIYICAIRKDREIDALYFLMHEGKKVSSVPVATIKNEIIQWL